MLCERADRSRKSAATIVFEIMIDYSYFDLLSRSLCIDFRKLSVYGDIASQAATWNSS